jgi:hypothetical protein
MNKRIEFDWPLLPGSISTAESQCGKEPCICKRRRSPQLHGVYYRWTGFIEGKRTTKTLTREQALECKRRIRNFRKLQQQIEQLVREGMASAPWIVR